MRLTFPNKQMLHGVAVCAMLLCGQMATAQIAVDPLGISFTSPEGYQAEASMGALTEELSGEGGSASASMLSPIVPMAYEGSVTGIADAKPYNGDIKVWPNPATSYLNVRASNGIEQITIADVAGHTLQQFTDVAESELSVEVSGMPSGTYLIQVVTTDNAIFGGRFIKK